MRYAAIKKEASLSTCLMANKLLALAKANKLPASTQEQTTKTEQNNCHWLGYNRKIY
jgi:hypothetical protein